MSVLSMQGVSCTDSVGPGHPWLTAVLGLSLHQSPRDCIQFSMLNFLFPCLPLDKKCVVETFFET